MNHYHAIVRYENGSKVQFKIDNVMSLDEALKVLVAESGAKVGLIVVPKTEQNYDYEPEAA